MDSQRISNDNCCEFGKESSTDAKSSDDDNEYVTEQNKTDTTAALVGIPLPTIPSMKSPTIKIHFNPLNPLDTIGINTRRKQFSPIVDLHAKICDGVTDARQKVQDLLMDGAQIHTKSRVETVS